VIQHSGRSKGRKARDHIRTSYPDANESYRPLGVVPWQVAELAARLRPPITTGSGVSHIASTGARSIVAERRERLAPVRAQGWLWTSKLDTTPAGMPYRGELRGAAEHRVGARGALTRSLASSSNESEAT
jgi:hypothetical protein